MLDCKPMSTPLDVKLKPPEHSTPLADPSFYCGIVGALQYLTLTRSDLSYSVNYVSQFMHAPTVAHMKLVHHILWYLKGTISTGLHLTSHTTLTLFAFSDADWAGCPTTRRSTTGYCTFLSSNIISWCAKKQHTISRSSSEAEKCAMANTVAELTWLTYILSDLRISLPSLPTLYCDNISCEVPTPGLTLRWSPSSPPGSLDGSPHSLVLLWQVPIAFFFRLHESFPFQLGPCGLGSSSHGGERKRQ